MSSEASESSHTVEFLAWLEVNKIRVITVAGIIAAVVALLALYRWHKGEVELQANTALLKTLSEAGRGEAAPRVAPAALLKIATDFSATSAGTRALLLGAATLFDEAKYAEAREQFEKFLAQYGDTSFAGTAAYGVAACLDAEGKTNEAVTAYQNVVARYGNSATATQARLALASLYEARKDYHQAVRLYAEVAGPAAQSLWGAEAAQRREELVRQHPELARTNAPAATPSAAPGVLNLTPSNATTAPASGS